MLDRINALSPIRYTALALSLAGHQVFRLYWPLASVHSFAAGQPRDKVSSSGEEETAAAVVPA